MVSLSLSSVLIQEAIKLLAPLNFRKGKTDLGPTCGGPPPPYVMHVYTKDVIEAVHAKYEAIEMETVMSSKRLEAKDAA